MTDTRSKFSCDVLGYSKETLIEIQDRLPCRNSQLHVLLKLLGRRTSIVSPCLFLYGHTATGKSLVVETLLKELELPHALVNCIECFTSRMVFESILLQLENSDDIGEEMVYPRCDSMNAFIRLLKHHFEGHDLNDETFYIVLDKAERLRDMEAHILPAFLRLQELLQFNICVIMISEIVFEKFRFGTGFREPLTVHFPDYTKQELLQIMSKDSPSDQPREFYVAYCQLLLSVFFSVCRDLNELRHLAALHFKKYCEPVRLGNATHNDGRKLWRNIEPHLKKALQTVYLREVSSEQWENMMQQDTSADGNPVTLSSRSHIELPFYSKYLLIAAYLASYNPARTDGRFFSKNAQKKTARKTKPTSSANKKSSQLMGPKSFPLDRLMAIFYSIVEEKVAPSANILSQISSLVSLKLLAQTAADDQIDSAKYKCLVTFDFIRSLGRQLEFDVVQYLFDFV